MRRPAFTVTPARMAVVEIDPGLALAAIEKLPTSDWRTPRGTHDLMQLCNDAYLEHVGPERRGIRLDLGDFEALTTLHARMEALGRLMETGRIEPGDASSRAVAEATRSARLMRDEDGFRFDPQEFFTLLDRADAEPRE